MLPAVSPVRAIRYLRAGDPGERGRPRAVAGALDPVHVAAAVAPARVQGLRYAVFAKQQAAVD